MNSIDRYSYRIVIDISNDIERNAFTKSFNWNGLTISFFLLSILLSLFSPNQIHTFVEEEKKNKTINTKHTAHGVRRSVTVCNSICSIQYSIRIDWIALIDPTNYSSYQSPLCFSGAVSFGVFSLLVNIWFSVSIIIIRLNFIIWMRMAEFAWMPTEYMYQQHQLVSR